jgi:hypothetical protein
VFSKLLRRTHLYLALFLGPWILMYAASTFAMNHRAWFRGEPAPPPRWEIVSSSTYTGEFPPDANSFLMAQQLLAGLGMDGAHSPTLRDGKLVIQRFDAMRPLRITYTLSDKRLLVERQVWEGAAFLERMHRRRGFQHPYTLDDFWASSVDLFWIAVLFWSLSGLWLWWELKTTRRLGALFLIGGLAVFGLFLAVL